MKDNIVTSQGVPTTCASEIIRNYQSPFEAEVLAKFRHNDGFKLVGKTNMDEFGMGSHSINSSWGPVRRKVSPLRDFSPGGSSGGSAVAVADNLCDIGIGTDTGGSVRLPAAYTGIVGFKPSYGLISRWGVIAYANSLDTVGFLTRSVLDSEDALRQSMGHDHRDSTSISHKDLRRIFIDPENKKTSKLEKSNRPNSSAFPDWLKEITVGFSLEHNITELDPEILCVWKLTLKLLRTIGVKVIPISLPATKYALSAYYILAPAEAASNLARYDGIRYGTMSKNTGKPEESLFSLTRGEKLGPEVRRRILLGSYTLSSKKINNYFIKAQKVRRLVQQDFNRVFKAVNPLCEPEQFDKTQPHEENSVPDGLGPGKVDFIISPTTPTYPPKIQHVKKQKPLETYINDIFTVPPSLAGLPSLSIPVKLLDDSLFAVGIQITGQYGTDFDLLRFGTQFERLVYRLKKDLINLKTKNLADKKYRCSKDTE